eukprot:scaffold106832_cov68-Phaeocystis_antarctica.AAC.1
MHPFTPPYTPYTPLYLLTHPCSLLHPATPRCTGKTFLGEAGAKLGKELLAAKRAGFPILMLHENDPAKHGCEFSVFFDGRTPSDLMQEGIYSALALALYPGEFQATSVALAALALGATEVSPSARLKARIIDKCNKRKGGTDTQQVHIVPSGKKAQAVSRRSRFSRGHDFSCKSAAVEPTTSDLSTNLEMAAVTRRTSSWLARSPSTLADLAGGDGGDGGGMDDGRGGGEGAWGGGDGGGGDGGDGGGCGGGGGGDEGAGVGGGGEGNEGGGCGGGIGGGEGEESSGEGFPSSRVERI